MNKDLFKEIIIYVIIIVILGSLGLGGLYTLNDSKNYVEWCNERGIYLQGNNVCLVGNFTTYNYTDYEELINKEVGNIQEMKGETNEKEAKASGENAK